MPLTITPCQGSTPAAGTIPEVILATPGIFAFWKLDELAGTTAADSSGNGWTLSTAAPSGVPFDNPDWGDTALGPGATTAHFNDGNTFVTNADAQRLSTTTMPAPTGDFTVFLWLAKDDADSYALMGSGVPGGNGWYMGINPDNAAPVEHGYFGMAGAAIYTNDKFEVDTGYMFAATRTSGTFRIYVNAVLQTDTTAHAFTGTTGIWLGHTGQVGTGQGLLGRESYAAYWGFRALSAVEIAAIFDAPP